MSRAILTLMRGHVRAALVLGLLVALGASCAAVTYAASDRLIVASSPEHLEPGRFTDAMAHLWPRIRRHPTWLFELDPEHWRVLDPPDVDFFAYATAYDSDRAVVIGHRPDGV